MSLLLVPLLAQLATVSVSDRTEARYSTGGSPHAEGATRPNVLLALAWPRFTLSFGYGANLTLTPLESRPRELLVYHSATINAAYRFRRSVVFVSSAGQMGQVNFQRQALDPIAATPTAADGATTGDGGTGTSDLPADPSQPSNMPTMQGAQLQPRVVQETMHYGYWTSTLGIDHSVGNGLKLGSAASYSMSGGLEGASRASYPVTRGVLVGGFATYTMATSARNAWVTTGTLQQGWSSLGNDVTLATANEAWNHRLARRTSTSLSAGVSAFRAHYVQGYDSYSLYPTATAFIGHGTRLEGGNLSLGLAAFVAPTLDPQRATVDPRVGATATVGWQRRLFFVGLNAGTAASVSKAGNDAAAFDNLSGGALASYGLTDWLEIDVGGTMAQQAYRGATTIPFSYALMAGLTFGFSAPLGGRNR